MKLLFSWTNAFNKSPNTWENDNNIISISISQTESCFASARVMIANLDHTILIDKKYAQIAIQNNDEISIIFSGRLVSFPLAIANETITLEFISEPSDYDKQLQIFTATNMGAYHKLNMHEENQNTNFDDLFFSQQHYNNPTMFIENSNAIFYWDKVSGKLSLSNSIASENNYTVESNDIVKDSIKVKLYREPYKNINLQLSAQWIQHSSHICDIIPYIAQKFQYKIINSFSNIKSCLESIENRINKTQYYVIKSNIHSFNPNQNSFDKFSTTSKEYNVKNSQFAQFKRFYITGNIFIGATSKQKISETVNINIINSHTDNGRSKNIHIKLNAIQLPKQYPTWKPFAIYNNENTVIFNDTVYKCIAPHSAENVFNEKMWSKVCKIPDALQNDSKSSFFNSARGKNAILYAIQKTIATIAHSNRYIEISFTTTMPNYITACVNDQMSLMIPAMGKVLSGKIIKTKLEAANDKRILHFTIACCSHKLNNCDNILHNYMKNIIIKDDDTIHHNFIKNIEILNPPETQEYLLNQVASDDIKDFKQSLQTNQTKIKLTLNPLNTTNVIEKTINLPNLII